MSPQAEVTMTFTADVKEGVGPHEVADAVCFHVNLSSLNMDEADISAVRFLTARETPRPIQPGDLVEPRDRELDPREVVSVGRDFLTLDLLGQESPRLPKDNYMVTTPAEGVL